MNTPHENTHIPSIQELNERDKLAPFADARRLWAIWENPPEQLDRALQQRLEETVRVPNIINQAVEFGEFPERFFNAACIDLNSLSFFEEKIQERKTIIEMRQSAREQISIDLRMVANSLAQKTLKSLDTLLKQIEKIKQVSKIMDDIREESPSITHDIVVNVGRSNIAPSEEDWGMIGISMNDTKKNTEIFLKKHAQKSMDILDAIVKKADAVVEKYKDARFSSFDLSHLRVVFEEDRMNMHMTPDEHIGKIDTIMKSLMEYDPFVAMTIFISDAGGIDDSIAIERGAQMQISYVRERYRKDAEYGQDEKPVLIDERYFFIHHDLTAEESIEALKEVADVFWLQMGTNGIVGDIN